MKKVLFEPQEQIGQVPEKAIRLVEADSAVIETLLSKMDFQTHLMTYDPCLSNFDFGDREIQNGAW